MNPLLLVLGASAAVLGAAKLFKSDDSAASESLAARTGGGGLNIPSTPGTKVKPAKPAKPPIQPPEEKHATGLDLPPYVPPMPKIPKIPEPLPRIPEIPTPNGKTAFPPGAELAIVTASPGLMTRLAPNPNAAPIAPQGVAPNNAFTGTTIAVTRRGILEEGAPAGAKMEWWEIMTPGGGTGYVRAIGPNGESNARLTGQKIPGGLANNLPLPVPDPRTMPAPFPLPDPPLPNVIPNIPITPAKLDIPIATKEVAVVLATPGLNTRIAPSATAALIAPQGKTPNDAFTGKLVTVLEKGLAKKVGSPEEWWKIQTPGGGVGYAQAVSSAGKHMLELKPSGAVA